MEEGMALCAWKIGVDYIKTPPTILYKYPNRERTDKIPKEVQEYIDKGYKKDDRLECAGEYTFFIKNYRYVYGEYQDNWYSH